MTSRSMLTAPVLIAAAFALAGCSPRGQATAPAEAPAMLAPSDVVVARRADLQTGIPVSGTLDPAVDVKLSAPLTETIAEVLVKEGQHVAKDEVIARFRTASLEPAAASAKAQLELARADTERYRNLLKEGAVSQHDADAAEAQWRSAQATEAQARKALDDATVRSPIAGVIASREVQSGDRVSDGDPMFRIVSTRELEFEADVPSEFAPQLKVGIPVTIQVSGYPRGAIQGHVARVNATADAQTRQVPVYVRVPNEDGKLVGGLFATGAIVLSETRSAVAVPAPAIRHDGDQRFVFLIVRGKVEKRSVQSGVSDEVQGLAEVRSGVAAGDSVIIGAIEGLEPGQPVGVTTGS